MDAKPNALQQPTGAGLPSACLEQLSSIVDFVFLLDAQERFTGYRAANPTQLLMAPEQFLHRPAREVLPGELYAVLKPHLDRLHATGSHQHFSYRLELNGQKRYYDVRLVGAPDGGAMLAVFDATDARAAEGALRRSEEVFRAVFNSTGEAIFIDDLATGRMLDCNDRTLEMYGYDTKQEILAGDIGHLSANTPPYTEVEAQAHIQEAIRTGANTFEWLAKRKDGTHFWVEVSLKPFTIEGQGRVLAVVRDVHARKLEEEAHRRKEEIYRLLIENQSDLVVKVDPQGRFLFVSPSYCKLFGRSEAELLGREILPFVHPDDVPSTQEAMSSLAAPPYTCRMEQRVMTAAGWLWLEWEDTAVRDEKGGIAYIIGVGRDIDKRKKTEQALRESEERFRNLYENATVGIYRTTPAGQILMANPALLRMIGCQTFEELAPRIVNELYEQGSPREMFVARIEAEGIVTGLESTWRRMDGTSLHVLESARAVRNEAGETICYEGIVEDITERKRAEAALRDSEQQLKEQNKELTRINNSIKRINQDLVSARRRAEESDRLKTAFLANMSHEIRTPMNSIVGFSELILRSDQPPDTREHFARILNASCHQLLNVVNDIIDIAKIEAGVVEVHEGETNLNELLERIKHIYSPPLQYKGVELMARCPLPAALSLVRTDATKLNQILINLVTNATKFTERGAIHFGYSIAQGFIEFFVQDTGIGIDPSNHTLIFERFRQVDSEPSIRVKGTGLGLPICKAFVELLGGRIWVESALGRGAIFRFTIPYKPVQGSPRPAPAHHEAQFSFHGKHILVAEDEPDSFLMVKEFLKGTGAEVSHAPDGQAAIDRVAQDSSIQLIIMDIKMPTMNGLEATRAIRGLNPSIPIIALTAYAMSDDQEKCLRAGCSGYLSKPITRQELLRALAAWL